MLGNRNGLAIASGLFAAIAIGSSFVINGCGLNFGPGLIICGTDADREAMPSCWEDAGTGVAPEALACEDRGGDCVDVGTDDFERTAILLWIGEEEINAPECPERANVEDFVGYNDLVVDVQCDECKCSAPTCVLPHAIGVDTQPACASGVSDNYAAPNEWNGSCFSPAKLPAGSFASFALPSATVTGCMPSASPPIEVPKAMAPHSNVIFGGVGWRKMAKACYGNAYGECNDSGKSCVPNAEPSPPEFRYCVKYRSIDVDEANLPQCPAAFPERHLFYKHVEGNRECTECACSEPVGSQCIAAFSAYQDPACTDVPTPFFKDVAGQICVPAMPWPLGAIAATMAINDPGKCEPSGGQAVGEVKPTDPRLFCCQPLDEPSAPSTE